MNMGNDKSVAAMAASLGAITFASTAPAAVTMTGRFAPGAVALALAPIGLFGVYEFFYNPPLVARGAGVPAEAALAAGLLAAFAGADRAIARLPAPAHPWARAAWLSAGAASGFVIAYRLTRSSFYSIIN